MRKFINKSLIMLYLSFLLLSTTSCAPNLKDRVKAFQEAYNSHDVEKELSLCEEDLRFEIVGESVTEGKEELRKLCEMGAILNDHLTLTDLKVSGDTVTCRLKEHNDWFKAGGIDAVYYESAQFTFKNGLIKEVRSKYTQDTARSLKEFHASFGKWGSEKRSQELAELAPEGKLTKENVSRLLTLVREWREETEEEK